MWTGGDYYTLRRRGKEDRLLTLSDWIKIVKQLGMMHVVYYKSKDCYSFARETYGTYGRKNGQPMNWEFFLYQTTKTERKLIDYLDRWEKEYKERWQKEKTFLKMR